MRSENPGSSIKPVSSSSSDTPVRTGSGSDLAFAVMVLAAYFTMFSSVTSISVLNLAIVIVLGIFYITLGVYGYAFVSQRQSFVLRMGYFVIQAGLALSVLWIGGEVGFNAMILLPLAGHSVVILPELWRYLVNAMIVTCFALLLRTLTGSWDLVWTNLPIFVAGQLFILVFTQMAVSEEQSRHEIQALVDELEVANRHLRENALQAEDLAISKERNRMAREIHDGLGHYLTALNMQIKAARAVLASNQAEKAVDLLSNAESLTQKALVDVRQSVAALRETASEPRPLDEMIMSSLRICEDGGINVRMNVVGTPRPISPQVVLTLARAAQECANNAVKHSQAKQVKVELDYTSVDNLSFYFSDDGVGSDDIHGGYGLVGMKERVALLSGEISIDTARGNGFVVLIRLPG